MESFCSPTGTTARNMQVCIVVASLVACCVAQLAQAPPGWYPSGRALLLPSLVKDEPAPSPQAEEKKADQVLDSGEYYVLLENGKLQMVKYTTSALKEENDKPAGQLKQEQPQQFQPQQPQPQQAQYPVYYLQYQQPQQFQQPLQNQQPQSFHQTLETKQVQQYRTAPAAGSKSASQQAGSEPFAKFQLEFVQYPFSGPQFAQTKEQNSSPENKPEDDAEEKKEDAEQPSGYEAKLQYRDVKPISAPIYANNPTPLVRILKK